MFQLFNAIISVHRWAKRDFHSWPTRFTLEISAWFMSIGCAVTMAATLPHPPFLILYPIFIIQCVIFGWSAWTRKSTGLVANYLLLVTIDLIGLARLIIIQ
jgi:hypothetical protein